MLLYVPSKQALPHRRREKTLIQKSILLDYCMSAARSQKSDIFPHIKEVFPHQNDLPSRQSDLFPYVE
jgi:hypothetical protein